MEVVLGIDADAGALGVYRANHAHRAVQMDLGEVEAAVEAIRAAGPIDVLAGSPPCTDFSTAGGRVERETHAGLTVCFVKIAVALRVRGVLLENVPELVHSSAWAEARAMLLGAGYSVVVLRVNAAACGVAQVRRRVFAIAVLGGDVEAMRRLQRTAASYNRTPSDAKTVRECLEDRSADTYWYCGRNKMAACVRSTEEPAATLRTNCLLPPPPQYMARHDDRGDVAHVHVLTVGEVAAIASFPSGYFEAMTRTAAAKYIGNCVPPRMEAVVARWCMELLSHPPVASVPQYLFTVRRHTTHTSRIQRLTNAGLLGTGATLDPKGCLRYQGGGAGDAIVQRVLGFALPSDCTLVLTPRTKPSISIGKAPLDDLHLLKRGYAQPFGSMQQLQRVCG